VMGAGELGLRCRIRLLVLIACVAAVGGCGEGQRPFVIGSMCLRDARGLEEFKRVVESIAVEEGGDFVDGSARTDEELRDIGKPRDVSWAPAVNMGVELSRGVGMTAGNLGLPGYQVGVGFTAGSNPQKAHEFAARALAKIQSKWEVTFVPNPAESGILPSTTCSQ
jgi:hypothetical protein